MPNSARLLIALGMIPILMLAFGLILGNTASATIAEIITVPFDVTLTPLNATNMVGENHTATATVTDPINNNAPAVGETITFTITGDNLGVLCFEGNTQTTDSNGQAFCTYTGNNQGKDDISAHIFRLCDVSEIITVGNPCVREGEGLADKHWTMFVIPESPIGIIALTASSLAALGGFMFWKRHSRASATDGMTGLGI